MSKVLLIDNYDSFTYNLYHYLQEFTSKEIVVMRNDEINFEFVEQVDKVVISPGPGLPEDAGQLMDFLDKYSTKKEILGICLGQQAIAMHFGMRLINLKEVVHGQSKKITILNQKENLFKGLPKAINVGRYHSWVIEKESLSEEFIVSSIDELSNIMSIQHKTLPIEAVQFHPESVLTEHGKEMVRNWISK